MNFTSAFFDELAKIASNSYNTGVPGSYIKPKGSTGGAPRDIGPNEAHFNGILDARHAEKLRLRKQPPILPGSGVKWRPTMKVKQGLP